MFEQLDLKLFFDKLYSKFNSKDYLESDPLSLVYKYNDNKEFVAFITALFSYGRVSNIINFLNKLFANIGTNPLYLSTEHLNLYYRFQKNIDLKVLFSLVKSIYLEAGSLENFLLKLSKNLDEACYKFFLYAHNFGRENCAGNGFYFLFPIDKIVVSKRLNLFLRWMVRADDVDLGLWKHFNSQDLKIPLDTHILNFAIAQKLIKNKQNNRNNVIKVTDFFKQVNSYDPVKYDFAITRLGMLNNCIYRKTQRCEYCSFLCSCPFCRT